MSRILLVEDDHSLGYILSEYLQMHDFVVDWAKDGEEGADKFRKEDYDLCILDIMMPKMDGFSLAEQLKSEKPDVSLIFLTAKSMKIDKLKGFRVGCDDYIVKPVDEEELIARIHAVLKRSTKGLERKTQFRIGKFEFNAKNQHLSVDGFTQKLTQKESKILQMLCVTSGELVETNLILKALWNESNYFNRRSMDVYISKLRKYLSGDSSIKINNVHGKGYILQVASAD